MDEIESEMYYIWLALARRRLRNKEGWHIDIFEDLYYGGNPVYFGQIRNVDGRKEDICYDGIYGFDSYEEILSVGVKRCLAILKEEREKENAKN